MKFFRQKLILTIITLLAISCSDSKNDEMYARQIIDKCIQVHGGEHYQQFDVTFDFRKFNVHLQHDNGKFLYERTTTDSAGNVLQDKLTNDGFIRTVNGNIQQLTEKEFDKYHEGINALSYFVLLPYKLSEPAVILKYVGEMEIENIKYHKIGVSFTKDGGGKDHEDEFCYWINQKTNTMDYLSYASGGPRFRKATKRNVVAGITFQDYDNYEIFDTTLATNDYDIAFLQGKAKLLSKIEQTNYKVK